MTYNTKIIDVLSSLSKEELDVLNMFIKHHDNLTSVEKIHVLHLTYPDLYKKLISVHAF